MMNKAETGADTRLMSPAVEELQAYREIGTISELRDLKGKSIPLKPRTAPVLDGESGLHIFFKCGNCGAKLEPGRYCQQCGQRIDSEGE